MLKLLIDQDFDHDIFRGLAQRIPDLDAVTALQVGLSNARDDELLAWADHEERIVVTHDRRTMPAHAARRMNEGNRECSESLLFRDALQFSMSLTICRSW